MRLYNDSDWLEDPQSSLTADPSSTGIGMRDIHDESGIKLGSPDILPPARSQRDMKAEWQASLSPSQKFFGAMGDFGAALQGKTLPSNTAFEQRRKEKALQLDELKGSVSALEHGVKMIEGLEGPERQRFIDAYATRLDGIDAGLGETYKRLADRPELLTDFKKYMPHLPGPVQDLAKRSPKEFLKWVGTEAGMRELSRAADQPVMQMAGRRRDSVIIGWQQLVPPEVAKRFNEDGVLTDAEIMEMQQHLPEQLRFTEAERAAISKNPVFWEGTGVLHGAKAQDVLAARAKEANKPKKNEEPKTQTIAGKVYQWDPEKANTGTRLATDPRYVELGPVKEPGKPGGIDPKIVEIELKVADDYRQDSRRFADRRPLFDTSTAYMANRATEKTSAGDAALMFAYAKMRDPNDRLAVSETRDLVKLGNIFERIGASVVGVLDKGETLPDRVAKQMYDEIRRGFIDQNKQQARLEKDTEKKVKDYGGDPTRVVRRFAIPEADLKPKAAKPEGIPKQKVGDTVQRGGKTWKVVGFDSDGEPLVEEVK